MKRVLLLHGGWEGHHPRETADFIERHVLSGMEVVRSRSLRDIRPSVLSEFDLLSMVWTFGSLSGVQVEALLRAVSEGLGLLSWHGAASSFLNSRSHKLLLGGQFVGHFGGNSVRYAVHFSGKDPLTKGLRDFTVRSEQYYLLVDPAVKILAKTSIQGGDHPWLAGTSMPVAWKRSWGKGRVFYCSLGHTVKVLRHPSLAALLGRAAKWALRRRKQD